MNDYYIETKKFRSYSDAHIAHNSHHQRSDSSPSADLFSLVLPANNDLSLSTLICPICSLPMMQPTLLPCQHTFCFKCIQNNQQIRVGSVPIQTTNCTLANDNQTKAITCQKCSKVHHVNSLSDLEKNQSVELLINTLLCQTCHQLYPSNQLDTCLYCYGVLCQNCYDDHINSHHQSRLNSNLYRIVSTDETINISMKTKLNEKKPSSDSNLFKPNEKTIESVKQPADIENIDPSQINNLKKKSNNPFRKMFNQSRHRQRTTDSPSTPSKHSFRIDMNSNTKLDEPTPIPVPVTPVRRFKNLLEQYTHTAQHIQHCKQRQSELDRVVEKLTEVLTIKMNEIIHQISQYWMHIKQVSLDELQPKSNHFQIFDYLLKTCCSSYDSRQQLESYFEQNDEIKAALQVLSTTLFIVKDKQTQTTITQLFDREEQSTLRSLRRNLDSFQSSYSDELAFITERIHVYDTRFATWKNSNITELDTITYEWTQILEHDYPSLIERISNDYITKIPQIEKLLLQMLQKMRQRLLSTEKQIPSRRTSVS